MNNGFAFGGFEHDASEHQTRDSSIERRIMSFANAPSVKTEHEVARELIEAGHAPEDVFFAAAAARVLCAHLD